MKSFIPRSFAAIVAVLATAACATTPVPGNTSAGTPTSSTSNTATSATSTATTSTSATATTTTALPAAGGPPRQITYRGDFNAPMGVQLWSFRKQATPDPVAMLKMVRNMGITHVETAGLYGMTADSLNRALSSVGLRATSMHAGYDEFKKNPAKIIADAKALGAQYVGIAWYPHQGAFTEANARQAIADFNTFGKQMRDAGLTFFYHNHGYEPVPFGDGTLLDLIIRETDPNLVKFEMDVLWTFLPNVDPAALIRKYPGRFKLMHIKDMMPGLPRGSLSGGLSEAQKAVIGQGQVNWAEVMAAAKKDGLEHYYLEDESTDPVGNVPKSISYLEGLKF
jgi:sugar phosphate isomerase/epimerase